LPVPESPTRQSGSLFSTQSQVARVFHGGRVDRPMITPGQALKHLGELGLGVAALARQRLWLAAEFGL
jgi:hypothetical protein